MERRERPRDPAIAALAGRQHGVVAYRQLLELGFLPGAIAHRVGQGRLHRIHVGVYAVGHRKLLGPGRWMAAVLAYGPGALLSHQAAAALWELRPSSRALVDVTVPGRTRHSRPGIAIHLARRLHRDDCSVRDGIPVTSVARTLLDLAEVVPLRQLERAFEAAERLQILDIAAIERLCGRSPGRRGLKPLGILLADHRGPPPLTRSELERRFLDLCRDAGLPPPAVNVQVAGLEVDVLWREQRLVVELDGYAFHRGRASFERDRLRNAALQVAGYRFLPVTHRRLETDPAAVVETVRSLLGLTG